MADTGKFDVWLINFRGISYSRNHIWLHPDDDATFWDYSFEEFGKFDVPAVIDYILKLKNEPSMKLTIVSFSEGTTTSFFGLATNQKYF